MLTLQCTPVRDSYNSHPGKVLSISVDDTCLHFTLGDSVDNDRDIVLSNEDTKQLLKLLKFALEN